MRLFHYVLDYLLPHRCPLTGDIVEAQGMLSPQAWKNLNFIIDPFCMRCGHPFEFDDFMPAHPQLKSMAGIDHPDSVARICSDCSNRPPRYGVMRSVFIYDDASRDLILGFKHADQTYLSPIFAPWLKRAGEEFIQQADFILPVPLHSLRLLKRRYNQAGLLAQYLSKNVQVPVLLDGLRRMRDTKSQGYLSPQKRRDNIEGAFIVPPKKRALLKNKRVILIDDVYTTGATIDECVKELIKHGVSNVDVLTIARVLQHAF